MNASPYLFFNCPLTYSYHRAPSSFVSPPSSRFRSSRALARVRPLPLSHLRLLHRYVHVPVQARQHACVGSTSRRPSVGFAFARRSIGRAAVVDFIHSSRLPRVDASRRASVIHARVQLHQHRLPLDRLEEIRGRFPLGRAHRRSRARRDAARDARRRRRPRARTRSERRRRSSSSASSNR